WKKISHEQNYIKDYRQLVDYKLTYFSPYFGRSNRLARTIAYQMGKTYLLALRAIFFLLGISLVVISLF
ncbi:MAG: hypothetical protein Greene07144_91, partial [Parcubacteria group bacterium Greene0714_4]